MEDGSLVFRYARLKGGYEGERVGWGTEDDNPWESVGEVVRI